MEANKDRLTHDVADLFNTALADGVLNNTLRIPDTTSLISNDADNKWLMDQLQHDIAQHPYNIWLSECQLTFSWCRLCKANAPVMVGVVS